MTTTAAAPRTTAVRQSAATDAASTANASPHVGLTERRRRAVAFGLLVSAQFVVMLDTSIVNVALPSIQADLGLSPAALTWVVNAYVLTFGGLLLLSGRAADLFGRRRMFVGRVGHVHPRHPAGGRRRKRRDARRGADHPGHRRRSPEPRCDVAAAGDLPRTGPCQGDEHLGRSVGTSAERPGSSSVDSSPARSAGHRSSSSRCLSRSLRWSWPDGCSTSRPPGARHRFDWPGAATITGAVIALVHGCLGAADGGWTSPSVLSSFIGFIALTVAFIHIERRAAEPLVPLELFRSRVLSTGVALALLGGAARASTFVLVALYLQQALDMAPRQAGLAMVPTSLTGFAVSLALLPRVLRVLGPRRTLVIGLVILAAGHLWLAYGPRGSGYLVAVLPGLLLVATGVALSFTPTTMVIAAAMPETHTGLASGMAGSATQVGAALGTAVFTAIGMSVSGSGAAVLTPSGFTAAFTAAAVVALVTAVLGSTIVRTRH